MVIVSIRRVVSCFILSGRPTRDELKLVVFQRQATMPTFPSHWAACSGSVEATETPYQTAKRELLEETNLVELQLNTPHGLYVDVPIQRNDDESKISIMIRVYPFTVNLPEHHELQLRGTEHDCLKFISIEELETLQPAVPSLALAFHHATFGQYLEKVSPCIQRWANNKVDGATTMARNALQFIASDDNHEISPGMLKMFRPTMVAITNTMTQLEATNSHVEDVLDWLERESQRAINYATTKLTKMIQSKRPFSSFTIATFSRSSTLIAILDRLQQVYHYDDSIQIICSKSTPGDEGELMARDLPNATCVEDDDMIHMIQKEQIDLLLCGSDCIMDNGMMMTMIVNKIGTKRLASIASGSNRCQVVCCTDRTKLWDDVFLPPMEDLFEAVPAALFDQILMPPPPPPEAHCDAAV